MSNQHATYDIMIIPLDIGDVRLYIKGFKEEKFGEVTLYYKSVVLRNKGRNRKKTMIKCLSQLHESLVSDEKRL
ncbi:hypothetical protein Q73_04610 [Bacillus coahuilensis m2-6]|uniref:hypothetical protein n=1 Tax=Bacillus coahuilensis TaxID=408580 RepID=UPI0001850CCC|nr:hypothetical protein [Bacillus coahuilensis]KUP08765.1 hypothetical protein Q73_04610 [Bacillus coahuilensis m2-6]